MSRRNVGTHSHHNRLFISFILCIFNIRLRCNRRGGVEVYDVTRIIWKRAKSRAGITAAQMACTGNRGPRAAGSTFVEKVRVAEMLITWQCRPCGVYDAEDLATRTLPGVTQPTASSRPRGEQVVPTSSGKYRVAPYARVGHRLPGAGSLDTSVRRCRAPMATSPALDRACAAGKTTVSWFIASGGPKYLRHPRLGFRGKLGAPEGPVQGKGPNPASSTSRARHLLDAISLAQGETRPSVNQR